MISRGIQKGEFVVKGQAEVIGGFIAGALQTMVTATELEKNQCMLKARLEEFISYLEWSLGVNGGTFSDIGESLYRQISVYRRVQRKF